MATVHEGAGQECAGPSAGPSLDCAVVIPLYNKGHYVERAIRSVLGQTLPLRRVIVVDDGSTDDGPERVVAMAGGDPRIVLIRQSNAGVSAARNRGIEAADTRWVAFLDADDAYLPWFLREIAALIEASPDAVLVGTGFSEAPADFDLDTTAGEERATGTIVAGAPFYDRWWRGNTFHTSSICVRRRALGQLGVAFPKESHGEDLDLFFRLSEAGPVAWSTRVCALYAVGVPGSLTSAGAELEPLPAFMRLRERAETETFPAGERAGARRTLATYWLTVARRRIRAGDLAGASALMGEAITVWRPVYWTRTAGLLAVAAARGAVTKSGGVRQRARAIGTTKPKG